MSFAKPQAACALRPLRQINPNLEKRLTTYIAAAGAAGVSLMVLSSTAEATIVYTPVNVQILGNTFVAVDLNNDGIPDMQVGYSVGGYSGRLMAAPYPGNSLRQANNYNNPGYAAAVFFGVPIGPGGVFKGYDNFRMATCFAKSSVSGCAGPWNNIGTRYLGVRFKVGAETHYGWARVDVTTVGLGFKVSLTGYAYETTPSTPIDAGHNHPGKRGTARPIQLQPIMHPRQQSLGALSLGAPGLSLWRRE
ncbi:MAG TPA: hypothetical protein VMH04_18760 [Candidatus Solibacter sp.]|nr:hypothetical protein [Candidatus Solibacter sp.]